MECGNDDIVAATGDNDVLSSSRNDVPDDIIMGVTARLPLRVVRLFDDVAFLLFVDDRDLLCLVAAVEASCFASVRRPLLRELVFVDDTAVVVAVLRLRDDAANDAGADDHDDAAIALPAGNDDSTSAFPLADGIDDMIGNGKNGLP